MLQWLRKKTAPSVATGAVAKTKGRVPESFVEAAVQLAEFKVNELKDSRRTAWIVAGVAVSVVVFVVGGHIVREFLRSDPEPFVVRVDKSTGATDILRPLSDSVDVLDEVANKYWVSRYVAQCEGYDWFTVGADLEACKLMSSDSLAKQHDSRFRAKDSPLMVLKDTGKVVVKVVSVAFVNDTAQVRFVSEKLNTSGENVDQSPAQKWIATIAYTFDPKRHLTEQQRLVNPFGFRADSYRVDQEVQQ